MPDPTKPAPPVRAESPTEHRPEPAPILNWTPEGVRSLLRGQTGRLMEQTMAEARRDGVGLTGRLAADAWGLTPIEVFLRLVVLDLWGPESAASFRAACIASGPRWRRNRAQNRGLSRRLAEYRRAGVTHRPAGPAAG